MANKKFWLGILVMVLVFGMTVTGCDNDTTGGISENEWLFRNESSFTIVVDKVWAVGMSFTPSNFVLVPGAQQLVRAEIPIGIFGLNWHREDINNRTGVSYSFDRAVRTSWFRNN